MHPRLRLGLAVLLPLLAAYSVIQLYKSYVPYSLSWNTTASIPRGLYLSKKYAGELLARGDQACFSYKAPDWAKGRGYAPEGYRLCKVVAGIPGDVVSRENTRIVVSGQGQQAEVTPAGTDKKGRLLITSALNDGKILPGTLVLLATKYPNSLDSRYLGAFKQSEITHQIWPLWVYE